MDRSYGSDEFLEEERLEDDPLEENKEGLPLPELDTILDDSIDSAPETTTEPEALGEDFAPDGAPENYIFWFKGTFCRKLYRSQLRPGQICSKDIVGNNLDGILRCIWNTVKHHVNRKVEFRDGVPSWSEKELPDFEDIGEFVMLQNKSKKKVYAIANITPRVLRTWRSQELKISVFVYSLNVETNAQHQKLQKVLISPQNPDRSGATSTRDDSALAEELRSSHPHIEGHYSSWLLWANYVNSSPAHEKDRLKIESAPPLEIAKYFRWAAVSESARLQAMHRGMIVANVVNTGWAKDVADLEKDVSLALSIIQGVANKLRAMKAKGAAGSELFDTMESNLRPEESELSRNLSSRVTDCEDTDHA